MRPQGLGEVSRRRRDTRIAAVVLLLVLFVLAWALTRPGPPASVVTVWLLA